MNEQGSDKEWWPRLMSYVIYFDESYDNTGRFFLQGALFCPHTKFLHTKVQEVKDKYNYVDNSGQYLEAKYNYCTSPTDLSVCKEIVDAFIQSTSWFRCVVIDMSIMDLEAFGKPFEEDKIKRARMYKKFAELLIMHNVGNIRNAVLLTDKMVRTPGDQFINKMAEVFGAPRPPEGHPIIKHTAETDFKLEQYHAGQVCDILLGCTLGALVPPRRQSKLSLISHVLSNVGVPTLEKTYWVSLTKHQKENLHPKFQIWHWTPRNRET